MIRPGFYRFFVNHAITEATSTTPKMATGSTSPRCETQSSCNWQGSLAWAEPTWCHQYWHPVFMGNLDALEWLYIYMYILYTRICGKNAVVWCLGVITETRCTFMYFPYTSFDYGGIKSWNPFLRKMTGANLPILPPLTTQGLLCCAWCWWLVQWPAPERLTVGSRGGRHRSRNMNLRWPTPKEQHVDTQDFSWGQCHPPVLIWIPGISMNIWMYVIDVAVSTPKSDKRQFPRAVLTSVISSTIATQIYYIFCSADPEAAQILWNCHVSCSCVILVSKNKPGGANPCCWYRTSSSPWWPAVWSDFGVSISWRMNAAAAATKHHGFVTFSAGFLGDGRLPWRQRHAQFKGGVSCCGWEDPKPSRTNTTAHLDHSGSMNSAVWPFAQTKKGD